MSKNCQDLIKKLQTDIKRGDIKKIAKEIKKDHNLALELWENGKFNSRMLSVLIMDKKQLSLDFLISLAEDLNAHSEEEQNHISEWLLANQLSKDKNTIALLESWENHDFPIFRRLFWYHQARLRWTGNTSFDNTETLLNSLESNMADEVPMVQWTMNLCAAWIGVHDIAYRDRCIELGERTGLYEDEKVPKNCTPNYLPEFIRIEVEKK